MKIERKIAVQKFLQKQIEKWENLTNWKKYCLTIYKIVYKNELAISFCAIHQLQKKKCLQLQIRCH